MKDVQLKESSIDSWQVPFKLRFGQIGILSIKLKWTQLFNSPVEITLQNINILLTPKPKIEWYEHGVFDTVE